MRYDLAMTDAGYRYLYRAGCMPQRVQCRCGGISLFKDDHMAARYECLSCGHASAAMWYDFAIMKEAADE